MIYDTPHEADKKAIADAVMYLHGFRASNKAPRVVQIKNFFAGLGIPFTAPNMNCPDFENLTVDAMMAKIVDKLKSCPENTMVICASMSTVPLLNAMQLKLPGTEKIKKVVLTGPIFNYETNKGIPQPSNEFLESWKQDGRRKVPHRLYPDGANLHYEFVRQMGHYNAENIIMDRPTLLIHGTDDEIVDFKEAVEFHEKQSQTTFHVIDGGDHDLKPHIDVICNKIVEWAPAVVPVHPAQEKPSWIDNVWNKYETQQLRDSFRKNTNDLFDFGKKMMIIPLRRSVQRLRRR